MKPFQVDEGFSQALPKNPKCQAAQLGLSLFIALCLSYPPSALSSANQTRFWRSASGLGAKGAVPREPASAGLQGPIYQTVFYKNGNLNIEAYLYKPDGAGPFPVVIYNHGSRRGHERLEVPFVYVGALLAQNGYAVLVPERRGYGKSDGETWSQAVGSDTRTKFINRLKAETTDVLAGITYLSGLQVVDTHRMAIMGWSLGGIISVFAASERNVFRAMIDQAGGALSWNLSPLLQQDLPEAAGLIKAPSLCMDAQNDATTAAVTTVGTAIQSAGTQERTIIYPPFNPASDPGNIPAGHLIFSNQGLSIWENDVTAFLLANMS